MNHPRSWPLSVLAGLTAVCLAIGVPPAAHADPWNGTNPVLDGFGSDTTQDVMNGLASVIEDPVTGDYLIASYDAGMGLLTSSSTPRRPGESTPVDVPRANGSLAGKPALAAAVDGTSLFLDGFTSSGALGRDDVEFARSSSEGTWQLAGRFNYIPFAIDAVSYGYNTASTTVPSDIPLGTVVGQNSDAASEGGPGEPPVTIDLTLKNIYSRNATTTLEIGTSGVTRTVGNQASGANIIPFKPQAGSGTLSYFQQEIGGTYGSIVSDLFTYSTTDSVECLANPDVTVGGRTYPTYNATTDICTSAVKENNGKVTQRVANAIMPFSVAQWIGQSNTTTLNGLYGAGVVDRRHGAELGDVDGAWPIDVNGDLNTSFPLRRAVFNIVEHDAITLSKSVYNQALVDAFVGPSSLVQQEPTVISDFGFGVIPSGGVTITSATNGVRTYLPGDTGYRSN